MRRYLSPPPTTPKVKLSLNPKGFQGTEKTVERMKELIRRGARDFYVRQKAIDILMANKVRPKDYLGEIRALFEWVRQNIRYTKDPHQVETLHAARRMLELRAGDCDDISILLGAMLEAIGHPVRLVLMGPNPLRPRLFTHVYLQVQQKGRWISLDATMPYPLGWNPPAPHYKFYPIEKEVRMIGLTEDELGDDLYGDTLGDLEAAEDENIYQFSQTVEGLDDFEDDLAYFEGTTSIVPGLHAFTQRLWNSGVRRRDPQVRTMYRTLVRRRRLGRRSWTRRFLRAIYRRGIRARHRYSARFMRILRGWGYLPRRGRLVRPSRYRPGAGWYRRPPWWYRRPPRWYYRRFPVRRRVPVRRYVRGRGLVPTPRRLVRAARAAALPVARSALGPRGLVSTAARLPVQAARTARSVATAPLRFARRLF